MSQDVNIPFATVDELKERWPDFPSGAEANAKISLEDASQFILDLYPQAVNVSASTRRRVVCMVVRRSMQASIAGQIGVLEGQITTGPFTSSSQSTNPHGDYYLTSQEKRALGGGSRPRAFGIQMHTSYGGPDHRPWCDLALQGRQCSCGADLTGDEPLWEA